MDPLPTTEYKRYSVVQLLLKQNLYSWTVMEAFLTDPRKSPKAHQSFCHLDYNVKNFEIYGQSACTNGNRQTRVEQSVYSHSCA